MKQTTYLSAISLTALLLVMLAFSPACVRAQSKATQELHDNNSGALSLFFYKNTLRMINQTDSKEFDEIIKDIEKMKFLLIDKVENKFGVPQLIKLMADYKQEGYEEIITSRLDGRNFNVYMKEKGGKTLGTIVLVNDSTDLYVLDLVGSIPISKVPELFKQIDQSSDIGKKIKDFTNKVEKKVDEEKGDGEDN